MKNDQSTTHDGRIIGKSRANSLTPRTDSVEFTPAGWSYSVVISAFAGGLERELAAANAQIERLRKANLQLREGAEEQKQRIQRLTEAGNAMTRGTIWLGMFEEVNAWRKAVEAKP